MKVFTCLVFYFFYNKILTAENMAKRGWYLTSICFLCRDACESMKHMFSDCAFSLEVYDKISDHFELLTRNWRRTLQEIQAQNWIIRKGGGSRTYDIILIAIFACWSTFMKLNLSFNLITC